MDQIINYDKTTELDCYEILGCNESNTIQQILAEYRVRALQLHPDKNRCNLEENDEKFIKLQYAKEILTNQQKRKCYDKWRSSGISMPFEKWLQLGQHVHQSMHWINTKPNAKSMIECKQINEAKLSNVQTHNSSFDQLFWQRDNDNDLLNKFRNYQI